jgi:hypothetical protein
MYVNYLAACLWYFIPSLIYDKEPSWITSADILDSSPNAQFIVSYYWAMQTLFTIGYGDVTPVHASEQFLAILWMIFGVGFYSYVVGVIIHMIKVLDKDNEDLQRQLATLHDFAYVNNLSPKVHMKINKYLRNTFESRGKKFKESEKLLQRVSQDLRA